MPFDYVVYREHRLVISTASGLVTWDEIKARQDQTRTDPEFDPEFDQIVDLRSATRIELSGDQVRFLAGRRIFPIAARLRCVESEYLRRRADVGDVHRILKSPDGDSPIP